MASSKTSDQFQENVDYSADRARFEELLKKHFCGQALDENEAKDFKILGTKIFRDSPSSGPSLSSANFTPLRKRGRERNLSPSIPSTMSSLSSDNSVETTVSKASSGFARVLLENRAMKDIFVNIRLKDVEGDIFKMEKEFNDAAIYHAGFLLFIKYFSSHLLLLFYFINAILINLSLSPRKSIALKGEASEEDALAVHQLITDMKKTQKKKKGVEASRAYITRMDWNAFLEDVSKPLFNPLVPHKSGWMSNLICN
jgi:hypothetical protein